MRPVDMTKLSLISAHKLDGEEEDGNNEKMPSSNSDSEDQGDDYGEPEEFIKGIDT